MNTFNCFYKRYRKTFVNKVGDFSKYLPHQKHYRLENFYNGKWQASKDYQKFPNPWTGEKDFLEVPLTKIEDASPITKEMRDVPCSGLHNPLKKNERYLMLGEVCRKVASALHQEEIATHFSEHINTVVPKSTIQSGGEIKVLRSFFDNFGGDNVRYLARGFTNPGDHQGQTTAGYRWPYGATSVITPFNFPLEIPILQTMSSLFMGNKVMVKPDSRVALPFEEFVRLLHACGLPKNDLVLIHSDGPNTEKILLDSNLKMTLFTGSKKIGDHLTRVLTGRIKVEDAGLDWKILGPDVHEIDYVAHWIDHDSFAFSGQKCSAESLLFVHENWAKTDLYTKIKQKVESRSIKNRTLVPVITWNNKQIQEHVDNVLKIPGTELMFGGKPIQESHTIPECYGSYLPTAIKVPLKEMLNPINKSVVLKELFGPFKIIVEYSDKDLSDVLKLFDSLDEKLTAGVVSSDLKFINEVLGNTSNGTTYAGIRARTTGAPQNHWFGPAGDPRSGGIHTKEAIQLVWSCHREIIYDTIIPKEGVKMVQS